LINLNSKSKKLLLLQRNNLFSSKQIWLRKKFGRFIFTNYLINFFQKKDLEEITEKLFKKELDTIKDYLPKNINNIMDIGCGLGIINIFLNQFYHNKPNFYLLDKNRVDKKIKYGFDKNYESYNDLSETKNLLTKNSINSQSLFVFDVEKKIEIKKKIDLVISLKSMGYHYPLENYLDFLKTCCTQETTFIFDMSEGYFKESLIKDYFEEIKVIYKEKNVHSLVRLCCQKFKY
tara:strand:+ start:113 stop:811 length:699 start_codon:yes stop_codon:yes gene_type:complete